MLGKKDEELCGKRDKSEAVADVNDAILSRMEIMRKL